MTVTKKPIYECFKRALDIVCSGLALLVLSPIFLIIAIAVRSDGGPAFYSQERVGKNGKLFRIYKFRSMCVNADSPEMLAKLAALNEMDGPASPRSDASSAARALTSCRSSSTSLSAI